MISADMDGFIGCGVAADSILDAVTVLHGPGGCRMHMSRLSARYLEREFKTREGDFFFHHERIPCTYIDRDDYIYGASRKISMVLDLIGGKDIEFATVIQSPGASLIGDKLKDEILLKGLDSKTAVMDFSFMSEKFSAGFDTTLTKIAEKIVKPRETRKGTVNIIGYPFTCRGYRRFLKELKEILSRMGLEVIAAIGAGCTLDEFRRSSEAEFCLCIFPEYCRRLSSFYEEMGIKTIKSSAGAPFGYYSMEEFLKTVSGYTGKDASQILEDLKKDYLEIDMMKEASMNVGEAMYYKTFSVRGESSLIYPIIDFMARYFRMVPLSVEITESDPFFEGKIREILDRLGCISALENEFGSEYANIMFGPGSYVKLYEAQEKCGLGIDIALPSRDLIDVSPKSVLGLEGLHRVLDIILNSRS